MLARTATHPSMSVEIETESPQPLTEIACSRTLDRPCRATVRGRASLIDQPHMGLMSFLTEVFVFDCGFSSSLARNMVSGLRNSWSSVARKKRCRSIDSSIRRNISLTARASGRMVELRGAIVLQKAARCFRGFHRPGLVAATAIPTLHAIGSSLLAVAAFELTMSSGRRKDQVPTLYRA